MKNALIRGIIPLLIMSGISFIMKKQGMDAEQVNSTFIAGLIFTAVAAATVVYEVDAWTLKKQSLIHFGIMLVTVYPCLLVSGWFPVHGVVNALKVLGIFLLVGFVLWTIAYFIATRLQKKQG
ncbi:MAG: DUF3021 domain-containing protein [Clostridiales bacterium]|nr:DUF3021 domain-containing protein [Clostridiales bacterium]